MDTYVIWAGIFGALSAVSLLIGSLIGVATRLPRIAVGLLAAFGAGASRIRCLSAPAAASSRSISASTCRVWSSTSFEGSPATCPARKMKPLATTACDMRAPDSMRRMELMDGPPWSGSRGVSGRRQGRLQA